MFNFYPNWLVDHELKSNYFSLFVHALVIQHCEILLNHKEQRNYVNCRKMDELKIILMNEVSLAQEANYHLWILDLKW
jgi:hypothetical protein